MKYFLLVISFFTIHAHAGECKTSWWQPNYLICENSDNGLDRSSDGEFVTSRTLESGWLDGGVDQVELCQSLASRYNADNELKGYWAELTSEIPVNEYSKKDWGFVKYKYACKVDVYQYPFQKELNPICGIDGYSRLNANAIGAVCLTCENTTDPESAAACLVNNLVNIVGEDLSREELEAFNARLVGIVKYNQLFPLKTLSDPLVRELIVEHLSREEEIDK